MKFIDVEQGSEEWLKWRKTVITGTDCPAIMESSLWMTPYKCWQRKLGLVEDEVTNAAMERGKRLEPVARALFIAGSGIDVFPAVVESIEFPFLGCSLDGITANKQLIVEIKCGGDKLHNMAKNGFIPQYYVDQIQHQLLVTGALKAIYYSYDGKEGIGIDVVPDPTFKKIFLVKAREFWKCVANAQEPPLSRKDYKDMSHKDEWNENAILYRGIDEMIKELEAKKNDLRKNLISMCDNQNCKGGKIKIVNQIMRGRIAYDEIEEIKGLDLEKYRKPPVQSWKFIIEK